MVKVFKKLGRPQILYESRLNRRGVLKNIETQIVDTATQSANLYKEYDYLLHLHDYFTHYECTNNSLYPEFDCQALYESLQCQICTRLG